MHCPGLARQGNPGQRGAFSQMGSAAQQLPTEQNIAAFSRGHEQLPMATMPAVCDTPTRSDKLKQCNSSTCRELEREGH